MDGRKFKKNTVNANYFMNFFAEKHENACVNRLSVFKPTKKNASPCGETFFI